MIRNMPVYVRGTENHRRVFHQDPDCRQLTKKPSRGEPQDLLEVEIADLRFQRPCLTCYPDAPRARAARRFCKKCNTNTARACRHNGGIKVLKEYTWKSSTVLHDAGETYVKVSYVWPDALRHYLSS
jgi:hypothetical protein